MDSQMSNFVTTHRTLLIGGGLVAILLVAGKMLTNKSTPAPSTNGPLTSFGQMSNLGGLTNGIVYVPTQTSFETINQGQFSNDPNLTSVTNSGNQTTTTTTTKTFNGSPIVNPVRPPAPQPNPPPTTKHLIWDQRHSVLGGENLSYIASVYTRKCRLAGMPGSMSISWTDIWQHNEDVINRYARMHGHYNNVWDWIFPGESLIVPRWG